MRKRFCSGAVRGSRFAVRGSRFAVRGSRFAVKVFGVPGCQVMGRFVLRERRFGV